MTDKVAFKPIQNMNDLAYPYLTLIGSRPHNYETVYVGKSIAEFFQHYKVEFYQDYHINLWIGAGSYVELGIVENFVDGKYPVLKLEYVLA